MSRLLVDVDDDALAEAQRVLGTATKKDTVNAALVEVSQRLRRLRALDKLAAMGQAGDFDPLFDKQHYRP
ncbi:type II toxin-antitoxin system VapB family antitoxin [Natronosporangium hydrolyticum]|uniref:Type II toxin-antitoxin system VapB family antitoxin n=1 Tax=Natronosporangium hydrolyticum TaxID=2811111 RepID=A0A895YIT8_9ACTN|nr:type II toxin-antitoxin system VapB family antitoxin [Natronosporangium hydrolyticum]QSB14506.1 type II toxin-antitoxin system VapB family antitoxin [Natronosporangium hydrolyticum]